MKSRSPYLHSLEATLFYTLKGSYCNFKKYSFERVVLGLKRIKYHLFPGYVNILIL